MREEYLQTVQTGGGKSDSSTNRGRKIRQQYKQGAENPTAVQTGGGKSDSSTNRGRKIRQQYKQVWFSILNLNI
jgi:hypothetical protein